MARSADSKTSNNKVPDPDRWFSDWFQEDYLVLYRHRDVREAQEFLDRIVPELAPKPSGWMLDLACGAGRHAGYLASKGQQVVGLDLSMPLLRKASASDPLLGIPWIRGDMRSIPIRDGCLSGVFNLFTSFGYFLDDRDNVRVVQEVARVLQPGGWFLLDTMNPSYVENTLVPRSEKQLGDFYVVEEREIDQQTRRVIKTIQLNRGGQKKTFMESVRMYSVDDLYRILESEAIVPRILWGDYDGSDHHTNSPRTIIAAQAHATDTI
ncbi:hypothetical protein AMJ86_05035 [bacterium SM23_57]|nr:MAG: hypothetical protein AMJ86_05035 [bacterium SM23_57]